jgi:hypothetical protein
MSTKQPKTVFEKYKAIKAIGYEQQVPWELARFLPDGSKPQLSIWGSQISLGGDYLELDEARKAVQILVTELGGTVKWEK